MHALVVNDASSLVERQPMPLNPNALACVQPRLAAFD